MRTCLDCPAAIAQKHARYCARCRWKHRGKPAKYVWTAERDALLRARYRPQSKGVPAAIARVFGWPAWVIRQRARDLGLARTKEPAWTPEQVAFLEQHVGYRPVSWLWANMPEPRRTETAIAVKLKRLGMSRTIEGYSARAVALGFGVDDHAVTRWIQAGKIKAQSVGERTDQRCIHFRVSEDAIRRFVREYPTAFHLAKVDQVWFLSLVLGIDMDKDLAA